jgi:hypothetical protein
MPELHGTRVQVRAPCSTSGPSPRAPGNCGPAKVCRRFALPSEVEQREESSCTP